MRSSMLPWFEVIFQAPVFAAPELQSEAPLCTTNIYNVQLTYVPECHGVTLTRNSNV